MEGHRGGRNRLPYEKEDNEQKNQEESEITLHRLSSVTD